MANAERELLAVDTETTFMYDEQLPPLPVPDLDATLSKYLTSTRPLLTELQFKRTAEVVERFKSGIGPELQQLLLDKASRERDWVSGTEPALRNRVLQLRIWWLEQAYLTIKKPLVPHQNLIGCGVLKGKANSRVERSSLILYFSAKLWHMLRK